MTLLCPPFKGQLDPGPIAVLRSYLPFALRMGGSAILFGLALWLASDGLDWRQLWALSVETLGYCLGLSIAIVLLLSWRWRLVSSRLSADRRGVPGPLWFARSMWIGLAVNQLTPSTAGGDILRMAMLAGRGLTGSQAAVSVLLDRVYGLAGLLVLCLLCAPMLKPDLFTPALVSVALGSSALIAAAIAVLASTHLVARLSWLGDGVRRVVTCRTAMVLVSASALGHVANIAVFLLIARNLGLDLPVIATMGIMSAVLLFSVLPLTVAGWGLRELTLLQAFSDMDGGENLVLASITYGLFVLVFHAFGFLFLNERNRL